MGAPSDAEQSPPRRPLDERLAEKPPRGDLGRPSDPIVATRVNLRVERPDDIAAVLVGVLMLQKSGEFGQTRLTERTLDGLVERLAEALGPKDIMRAEIEAYRVLDALVGGDRMEEEALRQVAERGPDGVIRYDPDASASDLIRRAIGERFDLKIDYFSRSRGEMNTRRITPQKFEAETYVEAYCHARRDVRVFRLNRMTRCVPIHGRPERAQQSPALPPHSDEKEPIQISLLED